MGMRPGGGKGPYTGPASVAGGGIPVPTPSSLGPFPYTFKYTFTHTQFQTAALSNQLAILTLPARAQICGILMRPTSAFVGSGPFLSYQIGVGIVGTPDLYLSYFDVTTIAGNPYSEDQGEIVPSMSATTALKIGALATGANLSTSTAGSVDLYLTLMLLP